MSDMIFLAMHHWKVEKWKTQAKQRDFTDKVCSSKKLFEQLYCKMLQGNISQVQLPNARWSSFRTQLAQSWVACFSDQFGHVSPPSSEETAARQELLQHVTAIMTASQVLQLEAPSQPQEYIDAIHPCGQCKAPGCDGLAVEFFLQFWDVVSCCI